ncbi:hypothetical protein E2562_022358 [Oryza meyeriana var. granulata]|uniref:Uncharacterized protein n=1 Tax=Oryza meyeriana var. granulata TaxID=110450 RepID=A0A6G1DLZ8_9ORYZ|nr:hypothetical protein E2562_022358 [Oryza meyeriana var. granulata]
MPLSSPSTIRRAPVAVAELMARNGEHLVQHGVGEREHPGKVVVDVSSSAEFDLLASSKQTDDLVIVVVSGIGE